MSDESHKVISMDTNARMAAMEAQLAGILSRENENSKKLNDIHRRLCEPSPAGEPPLIERLGKAVRAYEQTSWVGKTGVWLIMTLAGLAVSITALLKFFQGWGMK